MAETSFEARPAARCRPDPDFRPMRQRSAGRGGRDAGIWFERNDGVTMPPATKVSRAPKIAVLVTTTPTGQSETSCALDSIFSYDDTGKQQSVHRLVTSSDWGYVATQESTGPKG